MHTGRGFLGVRVRAGIYEHVAIRWPSAEPATGLGVGGHGGTNPVADSVALCLGEPAEEAHEQIVCLGVRIDAPAHLGHPEAHAVVDQDGEHEAELTAGEGALRLGDDEV